MHLNNQLNAVFPRSKITYKVFNILILCGYWSPEVRKLKRKLVQEKITFSAPAVADLAAPF